MFLQGEAERRWQTARCSAPRCLAQALQGEFVLFARLGTRTKAGCQDEELQGRGVPLARWTRGARDWTLPRLLRSCLHCIPGRAPGETPIVAGRSAQLVQTSQGQKHPGRKRTRKQSILRGEASRDQQIWGNCWLGAGPWCTSCCRRAAIPCVGRSTRRWYLPLAEDLFSYGKIIFARQPCHSFTSCGKPGD